MVGWTSWRVNSNKAIRPPTSLKHIQTLTVCVIQARDCPANTNLIEHRPYMPRLQRQLTPV